MSAESQVVEAGGKYRKFPPELPTEKQVGGAVSRVKGLRVDATTFQIGWYRGRKFVPEPEIFFLEFFVSSGWYHDIFIVPLEGRFFMPRISNYILGR